LRQLVFGESAQILGGLNAPQQLHLLRSTL